MGGHAHGTGAESRTLNYISVSAATFLRPALRLQRRQPLQALLRGYEAFMDFDDRELRLIEALRTLRLIHHSAWLAKRWNDPAFPVAFPWFGAPAYWQQQTQVLKEQQAAMRQATSN